MSKRELKVTGMEEISKQLTQMGEMAQGAAKAALYKGAGILADEIARSIDGIETEAFHRVPEGQQRLPSPEEKALLQRKAAKGIAKFRASGAEVDTIVGMRNSGYGMLVGKRVPVPLIANSINSGTSFMQKQPFMRQALSRCKGKVEKAIIDEVDKRYRELLK